MKLRIVTMVALLSVCSAVSAKKYQMPPAPIAQQLPVEVILNQHEMGVDVPDTAMRAGMQFGLIGALVGAAIQQGEVSNAEHRVTEIRNLLVDYDFNKRFEARLRERMPSAGLSPDPQFTFMASPWDAHSALSAGKQSQKGIFVLVPHYAIQNDFEQMRVSVTVSLVDRTVKPNGKVKEKVTFLRAYIWNIPMAKKAGSGATEDAARWVALGAPRLSALLDEGVDQVVDMMVYDFSDEGRKVADHLGRTMLKDHSYKGHEVRRSDEWIWTRDVAVTGVLQLEGYHPIEGAEAAAATEVAPATAPATAPAAAPTTGAGGMK